MLKPLAPKLKPLTTIISITKNIVSKLAMITIFKHFKGGLHNILMKQTGYIYSKYVGKGLSLVCNVAQQENKEKEPLYSWKKLAHLLEEFLGFN